MSQMGMSTDFGFGSEGARRKPGSQGQSGDGQSGANEQTGADGDDDVPGTLLIFLKKNH